MRRVAVTLALLAALAASGRNTGTSVSEVNRFCADKGGVLSVSNGHSDDMVVCADKRAYPAP